MVSIINSRIDLFEFINRLFYLPKERNNIFQWPLIDFKRFFRCQPISLIMKYNHTVCSSVSIFVPFFYYSLIGERIIDRWFELYFLYQCIGGVIFPLIPYWTSRSSADILFMVIFLLRTNAHSNKCLWRVYLFLVTQHLIMPWSKTEPLICEPILSQGFWTDYKIHCIASLATAIFYSYENIHFIPHLIFIHMDRLQ